MAYGSSMGVFLLWHVRHAPFLDGTPTRHRDEDGTLIWNEEDGDDLKILGVYSNEQHAQDRIARARTLPGFRDEPDCFMTDCYTVDDDHWSEGFVHLPEDDRLTR
jgi:hypothetical protein